MSKETEKKVNEEKVEEVKEVKEEVVETQEEAASEELGVYVERRAVKGDTGKTYFNYFVKGEIQGREIRADLIPSDNGGYEQLDILFGKKTQVPLYVGRSSRTDASNKVIKYNTYSVKFVDEFGLTFEVGVKGREGSDRSYLDYIVKVARYKLSQGNDDEQA